MALQSLKSVDGWILLITGLIWLSFAGEGGIVRGVVAGAVGAVGVAAGVAALLFPGDLRILSFGALSAFAGAVVALLGVLPFGLGTSLGLAVVAAFGFVGAGRLSLAWVPETSGVPRRVEDIPLAAKVAVDEVLLASFHLRLEFPTGAPLDRAAREALDLREWFADAGIEKPADYHRAPPPAEAIRTTSGSVRGRKFEHISFANDFEPQPNEPGRERWLAGTATRTAHAYVVRTQPAAPWLVAIPGYRMGMPLTDLTVFDPHLYCERLGFNLLIPVLPLHGPRRIGRLSGDGYLDGDVVTFVHAEAQAMWDIRRLLGWIRSQGGARIGVMGLSLGGYNCALLSLLEGGLACAIAGIPVADFARVVWTHAPASYLQGLTERGLDREILTEILRPVSPLEGAPKLPSSALAIFAGVGDRVVPPEHQRDLMAHWKPDARLWYQGGHVTFRLDPSVDAMVRGVLRDNLSAPAGG